MAKLTKETFGTNWNDAGVRFTFANGTVHELKLSELSQEILVNNALHGISQRGGDACASKDLTIEQSAEATQRVLDNLRAGILTAPRGGDGLFPQAVARVLGLDLEQVQAVLADLDEDSQGAIRKDPRVKAALLAIRAERADERAAQAPKSDALAVFRASAA